MRRVGISLVIVMGLAALAGPAWASDATLKNALKPYKTRLTADVAYLAAFKVPSSSAASGVQSKLSKISKDLQGATQAANANQASTKNGRKGRSQVLDGLHDAIAAADSARACVKAVKAGKASAAKSDRKLEQSNVNRAIPLLESGGKLLKLF